MDSTKLLCAVVDTSVNYSFTMCNPPFFTTGEEAQDRSSRRPAPKAAAAEMTPSESKTKVSTCLRVNQDLIRGQGRGGGICPIVDPREYCPSN